MKKDTILWHTLYRGIPYLKRKKDTILLWHTLSYRGILYLKRKKTPYYGTPYHTVAFYILNEKKTPYYGTPYHTVAFYILNEKRHHIMAHLIIIPWHSISYSILWDRAVVYTQSYHDIHYTVSYRGILQRIVSHHIILWHTSYHGVPHTVSYIIIPWHPI